MAHCASEISHKIRGEISLLSQLHLLDGSAPYAMTLLGFEWHGISMKSQGKCDWNLGYFEGEKKISPADVLIHFDASDMGTHLNSLQKLGFKGLLGLHLKI